MYVSNDDHALVLCITGRQYSVRHPGRRIAWQAGEARAAAEGERLRREQPCQCAVGRHRSIAASAANNNPEGKRASTLLRELIESHVSRGSASSVT